MSVNFRCEGPHCPRALTFVTEVDPVTYGWVATKDEDGEHAFHHADCVAKYYAMNHPAERDDDLPTGEVELDEDQEGDEDGNAEDEA